MESAISHDDLALAAIAGLILGLIDWREGALDRARRRFEECQRVFHSSGLRREEAQVINNLGAISYSRREYGVALSFFQTARVLQEDIGDWDDLRNVYNNLADVSYQVGDYSSSLMYYEKLFSLAQDRGDLRKMSLACAGIAENLVVLGRCAEGRIKAETAREIAAHANAGVELGVAFRVLGDVALVEGNPGEAEKSYRHALPLLSKAKEKVEIEKAACGHAYALENLERNGGGV
jgi:tetratricopeptide (TPR) repeat protein